jgi:hypothetical protein
MLNEEDKREIQRMISVTVNHFHFDILESKIKKLDKRLKDLESEL